MILVIDNYDSFVYNLARYFEREGQNCHVVRNDAISVEEAQAMNPAAIVISPGPCSPKQAGISVELIKKLGASTPILGVCLGHQCIAEAYGVEIKQVEPMHGKASAIDHNEDALFDGIKQGFMGGRYHSLQTKPHENLVTIAQTGDEIVMAVRHTAHPVYGVQFHPESVLTEHGAAIIRNFMRITLQWNNRKAAA